MHLLTLNKLLFRKFVFFFNKTCYISVRYCSLFGHLNRGSNISFFTKLMMIYIFVLELLSYFLFNIEFLISEFISKTPQQGTTLCNTWVYYNQKSEKKYSVGFSIMLILVGSKAVYVSKFNLSNHVIDYY